MAEEKNFESQLKRLQTVVEELERGELPLEKSVALYKEGLTLAKECRTQLAEARQEIRLFSEGVFKDFSESEGQAAASSPEADNSATDKDIADDL